MKNKMKRPLAIAAFLTTIIVNFSLVSGVWAGEPKVGNVSGNYTRETKDEKAEFEVKLLPDGKVHVTGMSFWGTNRRYGPNIGKLDFEAPIKNGRVQYSERIRKGQYYKLELTFKEGGLSAKEEGISTNFGMNVTFAGEYNKNR